MHPETRAMQDDELANPGMLAVMEGETLWRRYGCRECHKDMKGVATRYPFFDPSNAPFEIQRRCPTKAASCSRSAPSCASCHERNAGKHLAGSVIPQGHPTGYPLFRLEWQAVGSLQRRLRNCLAGIRAETPAYGAPALVELELFLMWRANGMRLETPAVRP